MTKQDYDRCLRGFDFLINLIKLYSVENIIIESYIIPYNENIKIGDQIFSILAVNRITGTKIKWTSIFNNNIFEIHADYQFKSLDGQIVKYSTKDLQKIEINHLLPYQ